MTFDCDSNKACSLVSADTIRKKKKRMDALMNAAWCQKGHKIYTTLDFATSISVFLADLEGLNIFKLPDLCIFNSTLLPEGYQT